MIKYQIKNLTNGLRLLTAPIKTTEAVSILILTGIGGRYETKQNSGISHFLEHLFFKGSKNYPNPVKINETIDSLGAHQNAFTGEEYTGFYIQCAADDFRRGFDLISDLFLNPIFPEDEIERERSVVLEETKYRHDMPQWHVQVLSQEQMFPDHPLGLDLSGHPESIKKIKRSDIIQYFQAGYSPASTVVAICGNPKKFDWTRDVEKVFDKFQTKAIPRYQRFNGQIKDKVVCVQKKVDQTHFVLSAYTFARKDPRRYALSLLSTILGGGSSSRIFSEIRHKRGWAYDVRSDAQFFGDTGTLGIFGGIKQEHLVDGVEVILREIEDIKKNGPTAAEFERAKKNIRGNMALSLEDSLEIASFLADDLLGEDKIIQPEEIMTKIMKVKAGEIKKLAKEIFQSGKMGISVIGPKDYKRELEKII